MVKPTFGPRTAPLTLEQGSAATIAHGHKRAGTLELSQAERNQLFLILLHGLAGLTETINPSVTTANGLERSTVRQQAMVGGGGVTGKMELNNTPPPLEEIHRSGKIDFSAYISRRVTGVAAADKSYLPGARNACVLLFFKFGQFKHVWSFPWKTSRRRSATTLGMQMCQVTREQ